jgi:hypothetical protein
MVDLYMSGITKVASVARDNPALLLAADGSKQ